MIRLHAIQASYVAAAALFILSLRWMSGPRTARRAVAAGAGGMLNGDRPGAKRCQGAGFEPQKVLGGAKSVLGDVVKTLGDDTGQ